MNINRTYHFGDWYRSEFQYERSDLMSDVGDMLIRSWIPLDGKLNQASDAVNIQLVHQIDTVSIDCFGVQAETCSDFLRANAFHQQ